MAKTYLSISSIGFVACLIACSGTTTTSQPEQVNVRQEAEGQAVQNADNVGASEETAKDEPKDGPRAAKPKKDIHAGARVSPPTATMSDTVACRRAIELITKVLKAPSTAEFPGIVWDADQYRITRYQGGLIDVRSYVDAENSFGGMLRTQWRVVLRPNDNHSAAPVYLQLGDDIVLDLLSGELAAAKEREEEEWKRMEEEVERAAEEERQAELVELDKTAAVELKALLGDHPDLSKPSLIENYQEQLQAFVKKYDGTASAKKASAESAALAQLRLAFVWAEKTGKDATPRLQKVIEEYPDTLAAKAAAAR